MSGFLKILIGILLALAVVIVANVTRPKDKPIKPDRVFEREIQAALGTGNPLYTVTHDGHKWIVQSGHPSGYFIHHPDCPCEKPVKP